MSRSAWNLARRRTTAGKGDTIKRITERVSPRVFRVVALPAPTERENLEADGHGPEVLQPLAPRDITLPRRQQARGYVEPDLPLRYIPTPF
jgi:hypothetical protein